MNRILTATAAFTLAISSTKPRSFPTYTGLTWENPRSVIFGDKAHTAVAPRVVTGFLLATMAVLYFIFR